MYVVFYICVIVVVLLVLAVCFNTVSVWNKGNCICFLHLWLQKNCKGNYWFWIIYLKLILLCIHKLFLILKIHREALDSKHCALTLFSQTEVVFHFFLLNSYLNSWSKYWCFEYIPLQNIICVNIYICVCVAIKLLNPRVFKLTATLFWIFFFFKSVMFMHDRL